MIIYMETPKTPGYIEQILNRLTGNGHAAYLVGGCVRDSIMGREVHDWDVATSATSAEIAGLFDKSVLTGERFGTVTVLMPEGVAEVTTFRAESGYYDGRHPENVEFVTTVEEDLSRRDFTMNAIAISCDGKLVDPFGGLEDISGRIIRCVGDPDTRFN
jgi:tRNA nucleotidyltransferase (CCA-adding enzyme)